jgi:cytochrome oxidase Cu insertion factor (SCO1/SenC/PrrC family)
MTFIPIAHLGHQLLSFLLRGFGGALLVAIGIAALGWFLAGRRSVTVRDAPADSSSAGLDEPRARRFLRVAFGLLWIVDGLLQSQPRMPAGFITQHIQPKVQADPNWWGDLVGPLARAWSRHPVAADAGVIWLQVGLGLLILIGGTGVLARLALWASIAWAAFVWVAGEGFGGLLAAGASFLIGSPGAVLVYAAAAGLLLAPPSWWESGRAQLVARRVTAGWLLIGAVLQGIPAEDSWTGQGLSYPFVAGSPTPQRGPLGAPIQHVAKLAGSHPVPLNAALIVILVAVAAALWISGTTAVVVVGVDLLVATWWLAQDFGVLGGTGTDPNAALPLALLLCASLPALAGRRAVATAPDNDRPRAVGVLSARLRTTAATGLTTLGVALSLVLPIIAVGTMLGPADAAAVVADSGGGVQQVPHRPAPNFNLTDQTGQPVSLSTLKGKIVVLTFLDPVCTDDCPLIAGQLALADRQLGASAADVEFVAIDSNPLFPGQSDVAAFTDSHDLADLPNWHYLWGPSQSVQNVLADYGIAVNVPTVGMIEHSEGVYFITAAGLQAAYLDDGASGQLTESYADAVRGELHSLIS